MFDCDCIGDLIEEILLGFVMEYILFGILAVPILKILIGTWNCVEVDDKPGKVLNRAHDIECGSTLQISNQRYFHSLGSSCVAFGVVDSDARRRRHFPEPRARGAALAAFHVCA